MFSQTTIIKLFSHQSDWRARPHRVQRQMYESTNVQNMCANEVFDVALLILFILHLK